VPEQKGISQRVASIEELVRGIENVADPAVRSLCKQLVQSLMDFHASGIERMMEIAHESGVTGAKIIGQFGSDELISSLLLLYGLHPLDLRSRVMGALEKARVQLEPHGLHVELLEVNESAGITLRWESRGHTCPSSTAALRSTVEQAIGDAAPEITGIVIENIEPQGSPGGFVPLSALQPNGERETATQIPQAAR
jgi:Fe-S cluster biogenesis protein NfuA